MGYNLGEYLVRTVRTELVEVQSINHANKDVPDNYARQRMTIWRSVQILHDGFVSTVAALHFDKLSANGF